MIEHIRQRGAFATAWAAVAAATLSMASPALAQQWAPGPVELVIGNAPGGSMDRMARLLETYLKGENLIPVESIVLPKPGGGHAVALTYLHSLAGNGNHLMAVNNLLVSNAPLGRFEMKFSDFTPIAILYEEPMTFAVRADSAIKTGEDLAERLRTDPGSVSLSVSAGLGTTNHMAAILLGKAVGAPIAEIRTVSFESGSQGITAVLGGHVDVVVTAPGSMMQFLESGELVAIAIAGEKRAGGVLADAPTWKELGYDVSVSSWRGILAPPGIPAESVAYWEKAFDAFMKSDFYAESAKEDLFSDLYFNAADSSAFLAKLDAQFREYLTMVGVEPK